MLLRSFFHRACGARRLAASLVAVGAAGCFVASPYVEGGEPLFDAGGPAPLPDASVGVVTWTELYDTYFGPAGQATCSVSGLSNGCHVTATDSGAQVSGFVCGTTKETCWNGLMHPIAMTGYTPIVPSSELKEPTKTPFYAVLRERSGGGDGTMPLNSPDGGVGYAFTPTDLAKIAAWIDQGALDD